MGLATISARTQGARRRRCRDIVTGSLALFRLELDESFQHFRAIAAPSFGKRQELDPDSGAVIGDPGRYGVNNLALDTKLLFLFLKFQEERHPFSGNRDHIRQKSQSFAA